MAEYRYTAVTADGNRVKGVRNAESTGDFFHQLADEKLYCLHYEDISAQHSQNTTYRMKTPELVIFCRQLETMLHSGITISRIFQILRDKAVKPRMRQLYSNIYESLQTGSTLSGAMLEEGKSFPPLLIHLVASGEASGALDTIAKRLSVHFTSELKLKNKLKVAMIYPVILLVVSLGVVLLLFTTVLPSFFRIFEGGEDLLPLTTRLLMGCSNLILYQWPWLLLGLLAIVALLTGIHSTEGGLLFFHRAKLKIPKIGKLLKTIYTARFASSLSTLYASGIPILHSLEIVAQVLGNAYYQQRFIGIIEAVSSGQALAGAVEGTDLFDPMFVSLIFIGEESGNLEQILAQAAEYYDTEAGTAMEKMVALLEPVMILFLAIVIGVIVASVILPMYSMYSTIG